MRDRAPGVHSSTNSQNNHLQPSQIITRPTTITKVIKMVNISPSILMPLAESEGNEDASTVIINKLHTSASVIFGDAKDKRDCLGVLVDGSVP